MEIICVPAIVSVTYALIEIYKKIIDKSSKKDMLLKLIPLFAMIIGGILGVVVFYVAPQIIIANNVWFALIVGLCSGLSATGTNQLWRQLKKIGIKVKNIEEEKNENNSDK